ncbi:U6 snRNA phosphodiesterase Usb1 [Sporodiniella umbellata]|nr:U6 snRNA phosphodiesterase Usb1 [Sporodiniella umbellata]
MPKLSSFFDPPSILQVSNGRQRAVPHKENSWATYVYAKVDVESEKASFLKDLDCLEEIPEQHISLSKTVFFKKIQLEPFTRKIRHNLSSMKQFTFSFAQPSCLINDHKTRAFLTFEVGQGYNEFYKCMEKVDRVMHSFSKEAFYQPPRFHASIASSSNIELIEKSIPKISESLREELVHQTFRITRLYIKMGNCMETIVLKQ